MVIRRIERMVPDLIDEVDEERGAGVEAEYLDVGVGGEHCRVEADDVSRRGDQDAHLPSATMLLCYVDSLSEEGNQSFTDGFYFMKYNL